MGRIYKLIASRGAGSMRLQDLTLLVKKVLVGAVATVVPLLILLGGLHLTRSMLTDSSRTEQVSSHAK